MVVSKDYITIVIAMAALTLSVVNFVVQQLEISKRSIEDLPIIGFQYESPELSEEYGFYIENKGNSRAVIKFAEFYTENEEFAHQAQILLESLKLKRDDYYRLKFGPNFSIPSKTKYKFYTFRKVLGQKQISVFNKYISKVSANICYCNSDGSYCTIHVISIDPKVIRRGARSSKSCIF